MQRNKWRYLLLPALLSGQMAVAGPVTPDGLNPQAGAGNEASPSGHAPAATVT